MELRINELFPFTLLKVMLLVRSRKRMVAVLLKRFLNTRLLSTRYVLPSNLTDTRRDALRIRTVITLLKSVLSARS